MKPGNEGEVLGKGTDKDTDNYIVSDKNTEFDADKGKDRAIRPRTRIKLPYLAAHEHHHQGGIFFLYGEEGVPCR